MPFLLKILKPYPTQIVSFDIKYFKDKSITDIRMHVKYVAFEFSAKREFLQLKS